MRYLSTLVALLFSAMAFGQGPSKSELCGKKWYPNKYKEVNGKLHDFDNEIKALYTIFNCDGTFESWEDVSVMVKGKWTFDSKTNFVKMISKDSSFPMDEKVKVISCKDKQLIFIKKDAGGEHVTIYSVSR